MSAKTIVLETFTRFCAMKLDREIKEIQLIFVIKKLIKLIV
jgi:hypothetical protein